MSYCNFHTHTCFCDGKNTPEEMVQAALALGCPTLGFSGHAPVSHDPTGGMSPEHTQAYRTAVTRLQAVYDGKIQLLCGLEQDITSPPPQIPCDYIIGAAHYIEQDGAFFPVDASAEQQAAAVKTAFCDDWQAYAAAYYAGVATVAAVTHCQIVAHFDLVTKYNEGGCRFDESDPRYRTAALAALEQLAQHRVVFEINTGAIRRGSRKTPYPAPFVLDALRALRIPVILSSDAHDSGGILFEFPAAEALAKRHHLTLLHDWSELRSATVE